MNKKLIIGVLLSGVLIYLSVRGIDFRETADSLKSVNWVYALFSLFVILLMQALRSFRWGVILQPLEKIDQFTLFSVTCVGFLAIAAIPARLGELARPYLIARKSSIKMSSALGTVVVERALDMLSVLVITIIVVIWHDLPPWLIKSAVLFFILTCMIIVFTIVLVRRRDIAVSMIGWVLRHLPHKVAVRLDALVHHFIDGFEAIKNVKMLLYLFFLSAIVWLVDVVAIYILLKAFGFDLPLLAPFVVMIVLIAGIAIPTAPGFIGNWHYACILGLSLFGIPRAEALSFALVYHFLSIALVVVLGVIFLPFNKFSLTDMKKQMDEG